MHAPPASPYDVSGTSYAVPGSAVLMDPYSVGAGPAPAAMPAATEWVWPFEAYTPSLSYFPSGRPAAPPITPVVMMQEDLMFLGGFWNEAGTWVGPSYSGFDIETEAALNPWSGEVATLQFEFYGMCYLVHIRAGEDEQSLATLPGLEFLKRYIEEPKVLKIIHNSTFELQWMFKYLGYGLRPDAIHDTILAEYILAEGHGFEPEPTAWEFDPKMLGLGEVIQRRYQVAMDKDHELRTSFRRHGIVAPLPMAADLVKHRSTVCQHVDCDAEPTQIVGSGAHAHQLCEAHSTDVKYKRYRKRFAMPPAPVQEFIRYGDLSQDQIEYAAFDALWMPILAYDQLTAIVNHCDSRGRRPYINLLRTDVFCAEAIARMQCHGIPINKDKAVRTHVKFQYEVDSLTKELIEALTPEGAAPINLNAHQQMVPRLNELGVPLTSFQKGELQRHAKNPIIAKILRLKQLTKLMDFTKTMIEKPHEKTGNIHANFSQIRTATSRLASNDPNFQNIPSKGKEASVIRSCVEAPDGYTLLVADYSNIEMRLIAEWTQEPTMIRLFNEDKDLHVMTGSQILGISYEDMVRRFKDGEPIAKNARTAAKPTNFGLGYGASSTRLQGIAWDQYGLDWELSEAEKNRSAFFSLYTGIRGWHDSTKMQIKKGYGPYCVENSLGRRRVLPRSLWSKEFERPESCFPRAVNYPIQANSADLTKRAMVTLMRQMTLVIQVHDELVALVKTEDAAKALELLEKAMVDSARGVLQAVPNKVEGLITKHWTK